MRKYDVIVVGAGPAGSTIAYFLAQAGVKVCLVDKQFFPRDKVCGDGIVPSTLSRLERMGLSEWLESFNAPTQFLLSAPNGESAQIVLNNHDFCYGRVIPRIELDNVILRQAVKAGADLLEGVNLTRMTRLETDRVRVSGSQKGRYSDLKLESKLLITADGAHASFTRYLGLVKEQPNLVAIRAYFENVGGSQSLFEIHYDSIVMPGYAWIFPMGNGEANVGLGTHIHRSRQRDTNLKQILQLFIKSNHYAHERLGQARMVEPLKGYPLRSQMSSVRPIDDNILVAGEAAGLVNPLNGEGIGTALLSGELAAQHAKTALEIGNFSKSQLSAYVKDIKKQIGRRHLMAAILRQLVSLPGIMNRTVRRAQQDHDFAQILLDVIVEVTPPSAILTPKFIVKLLAG